MRVAVCVDNMGTMGQTPDEERDEIIEYLAQDGVPSPELAWYGHRPQDIPNESAFDVLVVDYGALWQMDTSDMTRHVLRYVDEHPSTLVLIWSGMTADLFVTELLGSLPKEEEEEIRSHAEWDPPWPANLRAYHSGARYYARWGDGDSVDWLSASRRLIQSWFGTSDPQEAEIVAAGPLVEPDEENT